MRGALYAWPTSARACVRTATLAKSVRYVITFRVSRRRREMYSGHAPICVCLSLAAFLHYCTDPDVTWGNDRECPLLVHRADLQSVHGFRGYDNIAPNAKCQRVRSVSECLYSFYAMLVTSALQIQCLSSIVDGPENGASAFYCPLVVGECFYWYRLTEVV